MTWWVYVLKLVEKNINISPPLEALSKTPVMLYTSEPPVTNSNKICNIVRFKENVC